ncbi:MAG: hypothetical protein WKF46_08620 [Candidatus Limnocylindrales bacterium]|jgi:hypothetical protein
MADDATEIELSFVRFNAAKAALKRATELRKAVLTHHSPAWYEAVQDEARCFNATYEAFQALQAELIVPAGETVEQAGSPSWYLRALSPGEAAGAPA